MANHKFKSKEVKAMFDLVSENKTIKIGYERMKANVRIIVLMAAFMLVYALLLIYIILPCAIYPV